MRAWILVVAIAVAAPTIARADDRQAAGEEFAAGQAADRRKDWPSAIQHYLRAYDLAPHPNALYNAAVDYERSGKLRDAATFYQRYLDDAPDADDRDKVSALIGKLEQRPSRVAISTVPEGGQITIDGTAAGLAPITRDLDGGTHTIAATLGGNRKNQRQISVEYGEPAEVAIALDEQQGMLLVTSNITGAQVTIDGQPAGVTPLSIAVAAGDRKVVVYGEGYSTVERVVKVPSEGSAQITASLVRPLGWVEPVNPVTRAYAFTIEGGRALSVDTNVARVGFGYHVSAYEALGRFSYYGQGAYGWGILLRAYLGKARIKPYLSGFAEYGIGSSSSDKKLSGILGASAGIGFQAFTTDRYAVDLLVDGGIAMFAASGTRTVGYPICATLSFRGR